MEGVNSQNGVLCPNRVLLEGAHRHVKQLVHHTGPRPNSSLKILYYNARSLLPKFDELLISADIHCPDVICITESWLCHDIQDSEIQIPGYQLVRLDRNRHGGGVLMYVLYKFIVKLLPSPYPSLPRVAHFYNTL